MTRARLRLFFPDDEMPGPTLSDLFDEILLSKQGDWDRRTEAEYRATLRVWSQIMGPIPVSEITEDAIAQFTRGLADRPGRRGTMATNTIRKHLRQLRCLLHEIGPRRNGRGLGYLAEIPYIRMPAATRRPVVAFTMKQLTALSAAGSLFAPPPGTTGLIPPAQWWKTLLIILWNTAWRIKTAISLQWEWIGEDGRVAVPANCLKGKRIGRRFYLNQAVRNAINALPGEHRGPVLPWRATSVTLDRWRRRLQRKAGIPTGLEYGFHAIRRASLSAIAMVNPLCARIVAGHAAGDVLLEHYLSDAVVAETLERLPQPF